MSQMKFDTLFVDKEALISDDMLLKIPCINITAADLSSHWSLASLWNDVLPNYYNVNSIE